MTRPARGKDLCFHPTPHSQAHALAVPTPAGRSYWPEITLCAGLTTGCPGSMPTDFKIGINV